MTVRARPVALLAALLVVGCVPGESAPTPEATSAMASSAPVAVRGTLTPETPAPSPTPTAAPTPAAPTAASTPAATPEAPAEPFAMNLASRADFVAQYTFEWCVGASLQMALNMATDQERTSRKDQEALWAMARDRSASPFGGANPIGWTATLNDLGIGPYELVSIPTYDAALATAAEAIRATDRPVGLVMWRGRHAWVMSGFESSADPRATDDFQVTGIRVHDPLYPHGSTDWGRSPKPNTLVSPETLARQFVIRDRGRVNLGVGPGWLLVLPTEEVV